MAVKVCAGAQHAVYALSGMPYLVSFPGTPVTMSLLLSSLGLVRPPRAVCTSVTAYLCGLRQSQVFIINKV